MVELLSGRRRATARLSEELGRTPTNEEVARVLGLPKITYRRAGNLGSVASG